MQQLVPKKSHSIRITYIDGGFTLITVSNVDGLDCIFFGNYDKDEMVERYYGISWSEMINDFKALIWVYFEYEINWIGMEINE